jgi:hypothetical protein
VTDHPQRFCPASRAIRPCTDAQQVDAAAFAHDVASSCAPLDTVRSEDAQHPFSVLHFARLSDGPTITST